MAFRRDSRDGFDAVELGGSEYRFQRDWLILL